jgi:hypothetical protein
MQNQNIHTEREKIKRELSDIYITIHKMIQKPHKIMKKFPKKQDNRGEKQQ